MTGVGRTGLGPPDAVILGGRYSALGLAQSLGSRGVRVWVVNPRRQIAGHSRWARFRRCPDLAADPDGWIKCLVEICEQLPDRPVVLAAGDREVWALSHSDPRLREVARVRAPSREAIEIVLDKAAFGDWATAHGLTTPSTRRADAFAQDRSGLSWPVIAKPRFRDEGILQVGSIDRFTQIRTASEWADFRHRYANCLHAIVVQEFIPGTTADMYSVGVCADQGSVKALFAGRKVRGFPALYGDTVVGESIALPKLLLDEVRRVVADLTFDGLGEFEYKREPSTGEFHLLELNPRSWSWIVASVADGSDLPAAAWELAAQQQIPRRTAPTETGAVRYVRIVPDFINVCFRYRRDRPAWARGPLAWWRDLRSPGLLVAESYLGDWGVLPWSIVDALRLELLATWRRPFIATIAQSALDFVQTALQAVVGFFLPRRLWPQTALALAATRARVDPGFARRSNHIERVLGQHAFEHDARWIELRRSASTFLDGTAVFRELRPGGWTPEIDVHGREHLTEALRGGRGAILWLPNIHFSRLLLRRALSSLGVDSWHLSRSSHGFSGTPLGTTVLNRIWRRAEDRYLGRRLLVASSGERGEFSQLRAMFRHLDDNGVVSITVGDQASEVALTPFFAGSLPLSTGPVKMARRSGAALLPVFGAQRGKVFEVWIERSLDLGRSSDPPAEILADYTRRLEKRVSEDPDIFRVWSHASAVPPIPVQTFVPDREVS